MTLDRSLLYHFVRDALLSYSEDIAIRDKSNPAVVQFNGAQCSIHLSYVHDSGNHRDNDDEIRIQISRTLIEKQRARVDAGINIAFIGFFEDGNTFVAWDPRHVLSLQAKTIVSVYARRSQEGLVETQAVAVHKFIARFLEETSLAIALPSRALGFYLENIEHFHRLHSVDHIQSIFEEHAKILADGSRGVSGNFEIGQDEERERFSYTRRAFPRDLRFTKNVLAAYDRTCCVCGRQLAIVQAAHIIPNSEPDSPNSVTNGLALCVEHHNLYDNALLLPGPERRLVFNNERADFLKQTKQERGLDEIAAKHGSQFTVPELPECRPSDEYLQKGLEIRMGP